MTISVPTQLIYSYDGDGATTVFAYPVRFLDQDELVVISTVDGVDTVKTLDVDYTVAGAGDANGGSITTLYVPVIGETITIYRATEAKQIVDLKDRQKNPAEAVEQQLDRIVMVEQDHGEQIGRAIKVGPGQTALAFPKPESDAFIGWNEAGDALENKNMQLLGTVQVLDEDDMASDSDTKVPTQSSVSERINRKTVIDTRADANGMTLDASITRASTGGFASVEDGGGADYALGAVDPSMPGQWSPADGRFAEIVPAARYKPSPFGILPEDDGAAALINDVVDWMERRGRQGRIDLLPEDYNITETISLNSAIGLIGQGGGQYPPSAFITDVDFLAIGKTRLVAQAGFAAGNPLVRLKTDAGSKYVKHAIEMKGLVIDCANVATRGIDLVSIKNSKFEDILILRPAGFGLLLNNLSAIDAVTEGNSATQFNRFDGITVWLGNSGSAIGIRLTGNETFNCNQNGWRDIKVVHANGTGIDLVNCDADTWCNVNTYAHGAGYGAIFHGGPSQAESCRSVKMFGVEFSGPGAAQGGCKATFETVGANKIELFGYTTGNASPLPEIEDGARLHYYPDLYEYVDDPIGPRRYVTRTSAYVASTFYREFYRSKLNDGSLEEVASHEVSISGGAGSEGSAQHFKTWSNGKLATQFQVQPEGIAVGGGNAIKSIVWGGAPLDFPSVAAGGTQELTISVSGAEVGQMAIVGPPANGGGDGLVFKAFVESADTVTVQAINVTDSPIDPGALFFHVMVFKL